MGTPETCKNWLSILPSFLTAGAAIYAAVAASSGLKTWKAQLKGKAEYDVARRTLRCVLEVREEVKSMRAPFVSVGEMMEAFKEAGVDPATVELPGDERTDQLVYSARWKPLGEALTALEAEVLEAEVPWGPNIQDGYRNIRRHISSLRSAVEEHLRHRASPTQWRGPKDDARESMMQILHSGWEDDEYGQQMDSLLGRMESILRPHLQMVS